MQIQAAIDTIRAGLVENFGDTRGDDGPYVVIYPDKGDTEIIDVDGDVVSLDDEGTVWKLSE